MDARTGEHDMRIVDDTARTAGQRIGRRGKRRAVVLTIIGVAAGLFAVYVLTHGNPKLPAGVGEAHGQQLVTAAPVAMHKFVMTAPVSGEVRPYRDIRVFAPASGVRISEILVDIGDQVEKGQRLAKLDSGVADAQINAARASLEQAKIQAARTAEEYSRVAAIADTGALSKEEISTRRAAAEAAKAQLAAQRANYAQVNARFKGGYVVAPEAGLVIERNARVGEYADKDTLFRIVGDDRLEIIAQVSEGDMLAMKKGQTAKFTVGGGEVVNATLRRPPVAVNTTTRTGEALFDVEDGAPLRTGMYVRGEVETGGINAISAPLAAVTYKSSEPAVFVIKDGKALLTPVEIGAQSNGEVAVVSGLKVGDVIAMAGGAFLLDGDNVKAVAPGQEPADDEAASTVAGR